MAEGQKLACDCLLDSSAEPFIFRGPRGDIIASLEINRLVGFDAISNPRYRLSPAPHTSWSITNSTIDVPCRSGWLWLATANQDSQVHRASRNGQKRQCWSEMCCVGRPVVCPDWMTAELHARRATPSVAGGSRGIGVVPLERPSPGAELSTRKLKPN